MWIFNVGDLKSIETGLSFSMDMAWDVDRWDADDVEGFLASGTGGSSGGGTAGRSPRSAPSTTGSRRSGARSSSTAASSPWSTTATRRAAGWPPTSVCCDGPRRSGDELPAAYRDAFFELVHYPVHGAYLMNLKYYWADRNALAARQGRGAGTNRFADLAEAAHAQEAALTQRYNTEVAGGKWNGYHQSVPLPDPEGAGPSGGHPGRPAGDVRAGDRRRGERGRRRTAAVVLLRDPGPAFRGRFQHRFPRRFPGSPRRTGPGSG